MFKSDGNDWNLCKELKLNNSSNERNHLTWQCHHSAISICDCHSLDHLNSPRSKCKPIKLICFAVTICMTIMKNESYYNQNETFLD